MNPTSARQKPSAGNAATMNGRRLPIGVRNVSLHGPMTSGTLRANRPSAATIAEISVRESVNRASSGGRYAAVVEIENASPKAPSPSVHTSGGRRTPGSLPIAPNGRTALSIAGCLARARHRGSAEPERRRQLGERLDSPGGLRIAADPVDEHRAHPDRDRALDIVLDGVSHHRRTRGLDADE